MLKIRLSRETSKNTTMHENCLFDTILYHDAVI